MSRWTGASAVAALLAVGCGDDVPTDPSATTDSTTTSGSTSSSAPSCPAGSVLGAAGCQPVGVPAAACGAGFASDGAFGCEPLLPAAPCADGLIAVPGDLSCRPLAPCGEPPWGEIPIEPSTTFVDAAYAGGDGDGSAAKPWPSLQAGIDAAAPGAIVAVAEGSYGAVLVDAPVRLWGRCPELVTVEATTEDLAAAFVMVGGDGSELRGLAFRGGGAGVLVTDASDVLLEQLWIHDTGWFGIILQGSQLATNATLRDSLVERASEYGLFVSGGAELSVQRSAIEEIAPGADGSAGFGVYLSDGALGRGGLTLSGSLVDRARDIGVYARRSDLVVEATVVRDTQLDGNGKRGWGIVVEPDFTTYESSTLSLTGSWVSGSHETGVVVSVSEAVIDATVVRDTHPRPGGAWGWGVSIEGAFFEPFRASASITRSLVSGSTEVGLFVGSSDLVVDGCAIVDTRANEDGLLGDALAVASQFDVPERATAAVRASLLADDERAGLTSFGAEVELEGTVISCNAFDLDGEEDYLAFSIPYDVRDLGGNRCGCDDEEHPCQLVSSNLAPPVPPL